MSALFLGEKVGVFRWTAVLVGFVGVLIALKPSAGSLGIGSLIAIVGSVLYAISHGRHAAPEATPERGPGDHADARRRSPSARSPRRSTWVPVERAHYLLLLAPRRGLDRRDRLRQPSLRLAPASVVVPYQYTLIVWAMVFGYLFFGDVPEAHTVIGAAIIVASGLFIFLREQRRRKASSARSA